MCGAGAGPYIPTAKVLEQAGPTKRKLKKTWSMSKRAPPPKRAPPDISGGGGQLTPLSPLVAPLVCSIRIPILCTML